MPPSSLEDLFLGGKKELKINSDLLTRQDRRLHHTSTFPSSRGLQCSTTKRQRKKLAFSTRIIFSNLQSKLNGDVLEESMFVDFTSTRIHIHIVTYSDSCIKCLYKYLFSDLLQFHTLSSVRFLFAIV